MANLDTASKRASSVALLIRSTLALPFPDGVLSQGDRQHGARTYSGILASAMTVPLELEDLMTVLIPHLAVLYAATLGDDYNTLLARDIPVVRADADSKQKDLNTDYDIYLS